MAASERARGSRARGPRRAALMAGAALALIVPAAGAGDAGAQDGPRGAVGGALEQNPGLTPLPSLNLYGTTGLIDMPTAEHQPDGELNATHGRFGGISRSTLTFQALPRVSGSFRYTGTRDLNFAGFEDYYDRSFDVRVQVLRERPDAWWPSISVGLQDFIGTGLYSGEYVVATKTLDARVPGRLKVTGGLGFGRLGSFGEVGSPFGERGDVDFGLGGEPELDAIFRGPAAPFGGIEWQATERLGFKLEYSSDAYDLEDRRQGALDRRSPINAGVEYRINDAVRLGAYSLYGSEVGASVQIALNPRRPPNAGSIEAAPPPVARRPPPGSPLYTTAWTASEEIRLQLREVTRRGLADQGLVLVAYAATADAVEVRVRNTRYDAAAQMIGRAARVLSATMPPSVETFTIVPVRDGLPLSAATVRRTDLEDAVIEPGGTEGLASVVQLTPAGRLPEGALLPGQYPRLGYALGPYTRLSYFDPSSPVRYEVGARLSGRLDVAPGVLVTGSLVQPVASTIDDIDVDEFRDTGLPPVRSDFAAFGRDGGPFLESLQGATYFRPGGDLFGRVSAGYFERQFGGFSSEVLWAPVNRRLALGVEVNYARKRDEDLDLGFQDYDVVTGHASAYYQLPGGFEGRIDAGRYLAGDWGATFALDRTFRNGWRVGGFFTLTDATAEEFGEGSFDKGLSVTIPLSWFTARPDTTTVGTVIRPVTRDGGARLSVPGRLYARVREHDRDAFDDSAARLLR